MFEDRKIPVLRSTGTIVVCVKCYLRIKSNMKNFIKRMAPSSVASFTCYWKSSSSTGERNCSFGPSLKSTPAEAILFGNDISTRCFFRRPRVSGNRTLVRGFHDMTSVFVVTATSSALVAQSSDGSRSDIWRRHVDRSRALVFLSCGRVRFIRCVLHTRRKHVKRVIKVPRATPRLWPSVQQVVAKNLFSDVLASEKYIRTCVSVCMCLPVRDILWFYARRTAGISNLFHLTPHLVFIRIHCTAYSEKLI